MGENTTLLKISVETYGVKVWLGDSEHTVTWDSWALDDNPGPPSHLFSLFILKFECSWDRQ